MMYKVRLLFFCFLLVISTYSYSIDRVISLAPSSTELIYAAGLGDKLIAVSAHSDYPKEAQQIEKVATVNHINIEKIIALKPDLIVAWHASGLATYLNQLETLGFNLYYSDVTSLTEIATHIENLSHYADNPDIGLKNAQLFRNELKRLQKNHANKLPISYFYQLSDRPIYTISHNHWPSEIFTLCGGKNIFEHSPTPYPLVGLEQIIAKAPEVIFTFSDPEPTWQTWSEHIPAIKNQLIWPLNMDWLNRPTPRSLKAIEQVCHYFDLARNV